MTPFENCLKVTDNPSRAFQWMCSSDAQLKSETLFLSENVYLVGNWASTKTTIAIYLRDLLHVPDLEFMNRQPNYLSSFTHDKIHFCFFKAGKESCVDDVEKSWFNFNPLLLPFVSYMSEGKNYDMWKIIIINRHVKMKFLLGTGTVRMEGEKRN